MNEGLIPRRYAKALYKVAIARKCDDRLYALMLNLSGAASANHDLRNIIANPFVADSDKVTALTTAAGATKSDSTFADFLKLLIENSRLDLCVDIANAYVDYYRKERNIHSVELISAAPLDPDVINRIKDVVEKHLHNATIEFTSKINPDLIGGFIVNVDNERLDASLRNRLKNIRLNLLNN